MTRGLLLVLSLSLTLGAAGDERAQAPPVDRAALQRDLDRAKRQWTRTRPANYELTVSFARADNPWRPTFATYRVAGDRVVGVAAPPDTAQSDVLSRSSIDRLFGLVTENLDRATYNEAVEYDEAFWFPLSASLGSNLFQVVAFRAVEDLAAEPGPLVVVQHVNHCGFGLSSRTALGVCPDYAIAVWGDGLVSYIGGRGVATLRRREHRVRPVEVSRLTAAIEASGFLAMANDYSSITIPNGTTSIDHAAEKWITVSYKGQRKTVHDFYGAPDVLRALEATVESVADSHRYTGHPRPQGPDYRPRPELVLTPGRFVELPGTALDTAWEFQNDIYGTRCFPLYLITGGSTTAAGSTTNGHVLAWVNRAHAAWGKVFVLPCDIAAPVSVSASRLEGYVSRWWFEASLVDVPAAPRLSLRRIEIPGWTDWSMPSFCGRQVAFWSLGTDRVMTIHVVDLLDPQKRVGESLGRIDVGESDMGWGVPPAQWDPWCGAASFRPTSDGPARELTLREK